MSLEHELGFLKIWMIWFLIFDAAIWSHEKMYVLNWKAFSLNDKITNAKNRLKINSKINWKACNLNDDVTNAKLDWK